MLSPLVLQKVSRWKENTEIQDVLCADMVFPSVLGIPSQTPLDSPTSGFTGLLEETTPFSVIFPSHKLLYKKHWFRAPGLCLLSALRIFSNMGNRAGREKGKVRRTTLPVHDEFLQSIQQICASTNSRVKMWAFRGSLYSHSGMGTRADISVF